MLGDIGIRFAEKPYRVINNTYRNIVCIVAPFKDDSFLFKTYNSLKEAVEGEKTLDGGAKGYYYLELLYYHFPNMPEIVLCNTTTNTGTVQNPVLNYDLTNERLGDIFEELDEVGISFLVIPETLTIPQYVMYKTFYDEQKSKMNRFGLFHQVDPTETVTVDALGSTISATPKLTVIFDLFKTKGSWKTVTTPIKLKDENPLTLEESVIYHLGVSANHAENVSETHYILPNVDGIITKEEYDKPTFDLINNSGAVAVNYRDKIHKIVQIYNSGTQSWDERIKNTWDLKHERVTALISNELRIGLLDLLGDDNDEVRYDDFESLARSIRDTYKGANYITGLEWKVDKTGNAQILVPITDKQKNIIATIDVEGITIIE